MNFEIVSYEDALVDEAVAVFNRETERSPFVVPLGAELFREQIAAKRLFDPAGCFLAIERDKAVGLALTCGVNADGTNPADEKGAIDGVFFPLARSDVGHALIRKCMEHLQGQGAKVIWGFASHGGYPFWRGLYVGSEPVCLTDYVQGWAEFLAHGFVHHQQSVNYLGEPRTMSYRRDLAYVVDDADLSDPWSRDSWRSHQPQKLTALLDGREIGYVGFVEMPFLSDYRGRKVFGIYGFSVEEGLRGQGIGSSLLGKLWELVGDLGAREVLVGTTVENTAARSCYRKAGMRLVAMRSGAVWPSQPVRA